MMPDIAAQLFAIAFLHVFPQCSVGIQVGREIVRTGNGQEIGAEILYRTIDRVGMKSNWTEDEEKVERDLLLERRILAFRSKRYPELRILSVECVKRNR